MSSKPPVIVDEGAQENGLAVMLGDLLKQNMEQCERKARAFGRLKGSVAISAPDAEVSLTMFFNRGSCVIFDGVVGKPDLHIQAPSETILALSNIPKKYGLPNVFDPAVKDLVGKAFSRELRISGMVRHPLAAMLLTYVMSVS